MPMPMMNVRVVSVPVNGSRVQVWMGMGLNSVPRKIVDVLLRLFRATYCWSGGQYPPAPPITLGVPIRSCRS